VCVKKISYNDYMPSNARNLADQASNLITISTGGSNFITPQVLSASIANIESNYLTQVSASTTYATQASLATLDADSSPDILMNLGG
jgi:hypothetical protein